MQKKLGLFISDRVKFAFLLLMSYLYKDFFKPIKYIRNMFMKQLLQKLLFSLLLVSAVSLTGWSQSPVSGKAVISQELIITLDETAPLSTQYVFSVEGLDLKDAASAEYFFKLCHDNTAHFSVDYIKREATVYLQEGVKPKTFTVADYNAYFTQIAARYTRMWNVVYN
jgi:hypothetical protein